MRVCGFQDDPAELHHLYDTILSLAVSTWDRNALEVCVRQLAGRFFVKDYESFAFPVDYIVSSLEDAFCLREKLGVDGKLARGGKTREQIYLEQNLKWSNEWLVTALVDGGLPWWRVFVSYARHQASGSAGDARKALYNARALLVSPFVINLNLQAPFLFFLTCIIFCYRQYVASKWTASPNDPAEFDRFVNHALPLSLELGGAADVLERTLFQVGGLQTGLVTKVEIQVIADDLKRTLAEMRRVSRSQ